MPPTYQYVADLKNLLFKSSKVTLKQKIIAFMNNVPAPQFTNKQTRSDVIENYLKRKEMSVQLFPSCKCSVQCLHNFTSFQIEFCLVFLCFGNKLNFIPFYICTEHVNVSSLYYFSERARTAPKSRRG